VSKSRFNRNIGRGKVPWKSSATAFDVASHQQIRATAFAASWKVASGEQAVRDDHGIIPRRTRRDMARTFAKRRLLP
jgi:hypothetical protein